MSRSMLYVGYCSMVGAAVAFALALLTGCGASHMTPVDALLVGTESEQQRQCVDLYAPDKAKQDECRAKVRDTWNGYWEDAGK